MAPHTYPLLIFASVTAFSCHKENNMKLLCNGLCMPEMSLYVLEHMLRQFCYLEYGDHDDQSTTKFVPYSSTRQFKGQLSCATDTTLLKTLLYTFDKVILRLRVPKVSSMTKCN
uniref:Uncharacterized protein n=1 Tax=Glossina palpalis gambiensis TaxID=67801 RepID=A0A1B0AXW3_9MUSC